MRLCDTEINKKIYQPVVEVVVAGVVVEARGEVRSVLAKEEGATEVE